MTAIDLIIFNARQLVTCASNGKAKRGEAMLDVGIIENGALAIDKGTIVGVGTTDEIRRKFRAAEEIDAYKRVVCPAFVDPHTHIVFAGNRLNEFELKIKGADYLEILENGGGIISTVKATRAVELENLVDESRRRLDKMLACGTGTAEIKTGYGLETETELKMLEAIAILDETHAMDLVPTFLPAHTFPMEYKSRESDYVDLICEEMLPKAKQWFDDSHFSNDSPNRTLIFADVFCEKNAFNLDQTENILRKAKELDFGIKAHVDEFTNLGGARLSIEMGAISIDHLDTISDEEIKLLAASNTVGIVTPTVNFNFGAKEFADARKMIDSGCAVAVSTDYNPGSAPCPSQPLTMAIACRYQKILPAEAFNAATINAAFAIGLEEKTGSLEIGKQADVLILETDDYRQVTYEFGGSFVNQTIKKGKIVFDKI